jgi:hypothetical protein
VAVWLAADRGDRLKRDGMDVKRLASLHRKSWEIRQSLGPVEPLEESPWVVLRTTPRAKRHRARKTRLYDGSLMWLTACSVLYEINEATPVQEEATCKWCEKKAQT